MKVVVLCRYQCLDAFVVHLARAIDVFAQSLVEVAVRSALSNSLLVVEFDFGDQQPSEPARIVMLATLLIVVHFNRQLGLVARVATSRDRRRRWFRSWLCSRNDRDRFRV